jgi:hypothetical protein
MVDVDNLEAVADELYSRLFRTGAHRNDPVPGDPRAIIREALSDAHNIVETYRTAFDGIEPRTDAVASSAQIEALSWAIAEIEGRTLYASPDQWGACLAKAKAALGEPSFMPAEKLVIAPADDYFDSLVALARMAAVKAMRKFPQPNYVALKIAEEAGEVVRAGVHYAEMRMEWSEVEGEIVQLLAMLLRFVTEGDQVNGIIPPADLQARTPPPISVDELRQRGMDDRLREVVELMVGDKPNSPPGAVTPAGAWALGYGVPCPCGERGINPDESLEGELRDICAASESAAAGHNNEGDEDA